MKSNTNTLPLFLTAALLSVGPASATVTFSGAPYGLAPLPGLIEGVDGWSQSEPGVPVFFEHTIGSETYGALGGFYDAPIGSSFTVSRDFALEYSAILENYTLTFETAIMDSDPGFGFPERNSFGMTVTVGAVDLLTITLTPENQGNPTPSNWAISYELNGLGTGVAPLVVSPLGLLSYDIDFTATGLDVVLTGGLGTQVLFSGAPVGYDAASAGPVTVSYFWEEGIGYGDNLLLIDNINLVPEPSSTSLILLGMAGIIVRRRR